MHHLHPRLNLSPQQAVLNCHRECQSMQGPRSVEVSTTRNRSRLPTMVLRHSASRVGLRSDGRSDLEQPLSVFHTLHYERTRFLLTWSSLDPSAFSGTFGGACRAEAALAPQPGHATNHGGMANGIGSGNRAGQGCNMWIQDAGSVRVWVRARLVSPEDSGSTSGQQSRGWLSLTQGGN